MWYAGMRATQMPLCVEESVLSFHRVDSRDQIQILGLGSKCIYLLSYFTSGPHPDTFQEMKQEFLSQTTNVYSPLPAVLFN